MVFYNNFYKSSGSTLVCASPQGTGGIWENRKNEICGTCHGKDVTVIDLLVCCRKQSDALVWSVTVTDCPQEGKESETL